MTSLLSGPLAVPMLRLFPFYHVTKFQEATDYMCCLCMDFYPREAMLALVFARAKCPTFCPSVCHTPVLCQNDEMISSPSASPTILVF